MSDNGFSEKRLFGSNDVGIFLEKPRAIGIETDGLSIDADHWIFRVFGMNKQKREAGNVKIVGIKRCGDLINPVLQLWGRCLLGKYSEGDGIEFPIRKCLAFKDA